MPPAPPSGGCMGQLRTSSDGVNVASIRHGHRDTGHREGASAADGAELRSTSTGRQHTYQSGRKLLRLQLMAVPGARNAALSQMRSTSCRLYQAAACFVRPEVLRTPT